MNDDPNPPPRHCVYVLESLTDPSTPPSKRSTYVGYTNNPSRRIRCVILRSVNDDIAHSLLNRRQHNGEIVGGAKKTKLRRPWRMAMIVVGFPTHNLGLRFEWALQHPNRSKLLRTVERERLKGKAGVGSDRSVKRIFYRIALLLETCEVFNALQGLCIVLDPSRHDSLVSLTRTNTPIRANLDGVTVVEDECPFALDVYDQGGYACDELIDFTHEDDAAIEDDEFVPEVVDLVSSSSESEDDDSVVDAFERLTTTS